MWIAIFIAAAVAALGGGAYIVFRISRCLFWEKVTKNGKLRVLYSSLVLVAALLILGLTLGVVNAAVCLIVTLLFWLIADLGALIVKKAGKVKFRRNWAAIPALAASIIYLTVGWVLANTVAVANYEVASDKGVEMRIVLFADSHIGTTFDGEEFYAHVADMQAQNPDVVIIAGDFVDDDTSYDDMKKACAALGTLKTKYGVFFAFGNHDGGYYGSRGYGKDELSGELEKNGVTVLEDEAVLAGGEFYIIGRKDASDGKRDKSGQPRAEIGEIVAPLERDKFKIVIDHQPSDYDAEAAAGVDLVLSGHTHGGQLFPVTYFGEWIGANDRTYGYEQRENTRFIVTSGISDWALSFKTGTRSEYVVIDVKNQREKNE